MVMVCYFMLCYAILCCRVLCYATRDNMLPMLYYGVCYAILHFVTWSKLLCCAVLSMLCYAMLHSFQNKIYGVDILDRCNTAEMPYTCQVVNQSV